MADTQDSRCDECGVCGVRLTDEEVAMGWPVLQLSGVYACPDCYVGAYCPEGHLLRGDCDSAACGICERSDSHD